MNIVNILNNLCKNLLNRLYNRYTGYGISILVLTSENLGVLPKGSLELIDGMPNSNVFIWVALSIALYFIVKKYDSNDKKDIIIKNLRKENRKLNKRLNYSRK